MVLYDGLVRCFQMALCDGFKWPCTMTSYDVLCGYAYFSSSSSYAFASAIAAALSGFFAI